MPGRQRRGTSAFLIEQVPSQARWSAQIVENAARAAVRLRLQKLFGSPMIFIKPVTFSQKPCAERNEVLRLPASWTESVPLLEPLECDWAPVPRIALGAWLIFFSLFLYQLGRGTGIFFLMDNVFVPIHEGGHLLFRLFGTTINVAGGTFLQLFVPLALAVYFVFQRQAQGVAFCMFFFFEQFLPVATYMADARAQELPLLTVGDSEDVIHDWNYLFTKMGLLQHDTQIAAVVRFIGWIGMIGVTLWLLRRGLGNLTTRPDDR
jgi:hypothetical protein